MMEYWNIGTMGQVPALAQHSTIPVLQPTLGERYES